MACLCNLGAANPTSLAMQTAELFLMNQMKATEAHSAQGATAQPAAATSPELDSAKLASYAGDYSSDELSVIYRLAIANDRLSLVAILDSGGFPRNTTSAALRATSEDQFTVAGFTLRFVRETNGGVTGFRADAGRTKGIVFKRVPASK